MNAEEFADLDHRGNLKAKLRLQGGGEAKGIVKMRIGMLDIEMSLEGFDFIALQLQSSIVQ